MNSKKVITTIQKVSNDFVNIKIEDNLIKATPNHLFRTTDGWKTAKELKVGEGIIDHNGDIKYVSEKKVVSYEKSQPIYNLEVEEYHTYYVSELGILVHNEYSIDEAIEIYNKEFKKSSLSDTSKIEVENKLKEVSKNGDVEEIKEYGDLIYYSLNRKDSLGKLDIANILEETKGKSRIEIKEMMEEAYLNSSANISYMDKYRKEQIESVDKIDSKAPETSYVKLNFKNLYNYFG